MRYLIQCDHPKQLPNIEAALKILDPAAEVSLSGSGFRIVIDYDDSFRVKVVAPDVDDPAFSWEYRDLEIADNRYSPKDRQQRLKELIRLGIINVVGKYLHKSPPWGILNAVRPTKIFHYLRDKGFSMAEVSDRLLQVYGLSREKADLLLRVGLLQERYFTSPQYVGVYVGIPFCPTRCQYCSFPAVSLETHHHLVAGYLKGLCCEIDAMSKLCRDLNLKVESIYIGGGTPTSLDEDAFARMIRWVESGFKSEHTLEFTVEAGRPETISAPKLEAMISSGVTRISVNPQTMHDRTLALIGRAHTVDQIYEAVQLVKDTGKLQLNMDLIQGLPDETSSDFLESVNRVIALNPENITVHMLAPKRAAAWHKRFAELHVLNDEALAAASTQARILLEQSGYNPYYLYRQRMILAGQENIGYAKPGMENIYNIQMMEERQTIIGIGCGSITKWVTGPGWQVSRYQNPKCPATYCRRLSEDIVKKAQQTRLLLG